MSRLAFALAAALLAPGSLLAETATPEPAAAPSLPAISVSTVGTRVLRDRVIASGLVGPVERVEVQPLIEGQPIETLLADVGDTVAQGQVLARLSATSLELQKSQSLASLASAQANVAQGEALVLEAKAMAEDAMRTNERTQALRVQGNSSQAAADTAAANAATAKARVASAEQSLAAARAQVTLAQAQLANIDLQLSRTEVKAPVAGEIVERNARIGAIAASGGNNMFVLIRDGALEVNADVAEADLTRLAPGQTAVMRAVDATEPLKGTIRLVEPSIDTTSRLGRVRISIEDSARVVSGMFITAEILVAEHEAVAVPVTAVGASAEGPTVMKVVDGQVTRVAVKTGIRDGGWVEVLEGIAAGDTVVTKAGAFVRDGDRINPVPYVTN